MIKKIINFIVIIFAFYGFYIFSINLINSSNYNINNKTIKNKKNRPFNVPENAIFSFGYDGCSWFYAERLEEGKYLVLYFTDDIENNKSPAYLEYVGIADLKIEGIEEKFLSKYATVKQYNLRSCGKNNFSTFEKSEFVLSLQAKLISERCLTFEEMEKLRREYNKNPQKFLKRIKVLRTTKSKNN